MKNLEMLVMPEDLKKKVLVALRELRERHLDDKYENGQAGSEDGEIECLKAAREVSSLIRAVKNA